MFRRIVLDPKILRELDGIGRGDGIGNERPEALHQKRWSVARLDSEGAYPSWRSKEMPGKHPLVEHFFAPDPFGTPLDPLGAERVKIGG